MAAKHNFKKLTIWRNSIELVNETYSATKAFPKSEDYALTSQIHRSAISIPSNVAEGTSKRSNKHFLKYLETALGSAFEWETQLIIAYKADYISEKTYLEEKIQIIQRMISRFMDKIAANK